MKSESKFCFRNFLHQVMLCSNLVINSHMIWQALGWQGIYRGSHKESRGLIEGSLHSVCIETYPREGMSPLHPLRLSGGAGKNIPVSCFGLWRRVAGDPVGFTHFGLQASIILFSPLANRAGSSLVHLLLFHT